MYIDRDAKVLLIIYSLFGIVWFTVFYISLLLSAQGSKSDTFNQVQIMIFGILATLTIILIAALISLKKEIASQQKYLKKHAKEVREDKYVQIPYSKSGLYSLIVASAIGTFAFLLVYNTLILQPSEHSNQNINTVTSMILVFLIIFILLLIASFYVLIKRIRVPLYHKFKACPRCGSDDIYKTDYSWWGGMLGPVLVHQVRCKKCGKAYDGVTGTNITKRLSIYSIVLIVILSILMILRLIL